LLRLCLQLTQVWVGRPTFALLSCYFPKTDSQLKHVLTHPSKIRVSSKGVCYENMFPNIHFSPMDTLSPQLCLTRLRPGKDLVKIHVSAKDVFTTKHVGKNPHQSEGRVHFQSIFQKSKSVRRRVALRKHVFKNPRQSETRVHFSTCF
jgi:hypothetical protein